ncbi:putative OsmC-like protein [Paenibacillus cellulosilyticus]|uniref:Putative OsmC-like protein n=1 Tax=Paenibacillus cellulosilyticus TaxID=375489 RepID=A0A2V2YTE4_9BACL|nr:OsmC family protein [Paenibacillus cellulosilyticus]PWW02758.1 putative OsmC-like protein [Paenibacillus cellulosilyticus]QKS45681.1 OsmC family protein [Paenibacillus cellulosilyticus]
MKSKLTILSDSKQLAVAKTHSVVLDRGIDQGGEDAGFRAVELWLIALSGCVGGSLNHRARGYGYPQAVTRVTAEEAVNNEGQIVSVVFTLTFATEVDTEARVKLLQETRETCKMLNTVGPHIDVKLLQHSEDAIPVPPDADGVALTEIAATTATVEAKENQQACQLEDGSCCI